MAGHHAARFEKAAERAQSLALAVAFGARKSQNLAAMDLQGDVAKARAAEPFGRQDDAFIHEAAAGRIACLERAADHKSDEIVLREVAADFVRSLSYAIAQNRHAIGEREDLR